MGRHATLFLFITILGLPLAAPGASPPILSLTEAVDAAWAQAPEARGLSLAAREWIARREMAEAWVAGPGALSVSHGADRRRPDQGKAEWELEVAWPLWLPGQRDAQLSLAEREAAALEARRQALRSELAEAVGRRHADWQRAGAEAELARHKAADAQALAADLERRLKVGQVARFEANLARAELLAAEAAAAEAGLVAAAARDQWILLTGLEANTPPQLALPDVPVARVTEPVVLRAARQAEAAATARLRVQQETTREAPELALRVLRQRDGADQPWADQIGVKLTLPFGRGANWRAAMATAEAEQARALAALESEGRRTEQVQRQAEAEQARAEQGLAGAVRRQQLAEDNHKLADQAYRLGQFDLATLLRARAAAFEAAVDVCRAEARLQLARLQHLLNSGVSP